MARVLMKGTEAIAEAAVRSGCRFFAGYPITPQNEIPEYMARRLPEVGGRFVQGESEVASVNMVFGAGLAGQRAMTSSSSTGISLKSEGISFCAAARIPMVYVNVARGGPGVGTIQPSQMDYLQATKASGNGGFRMLVFAPATVQEAVDMTYRAFDCADRDRNPVLVLSDGVIGTMMEPVELPPMRSDKELEEIFAAKKAWAGIGHPLNVSRSWEQPGGWDTIWWEQRNKAAAAMYESWIPEVETQYLEDAELVLAAYGISARVAAGAMQTLRREGFRVGLIRPKTVNPYPYSAYDGINYNTCKAVLDVEMAIPALHVWDVEKGVKGRCRIETCLRSGGNLIQKSDILAAARRLLDGKER